MPWWSCRSPACAWDGICAGRRTRSCMGGTPGIPFRSRHCPAIPPLISGSTGKRRATRNLYGCWVFFLSWPGCLESSRRFGGSGPLPLHFLRENHDRPLQSRHSRRPQGIAIGMARPKGAPLVWRLPDAPQARKLERRRERNGKQAEQRHGNRQGQPGRKRDNRDAERGAWKAGSRE